MPTVTIAHAEQQDLPTINSLIARSKKHWPYSAEYLEHAIPLLQIDSRYLADNLCWKLVDDHHGIVGFASVVQTPTPVLDHLWIDPEMLCRGLGTLAFQHIRQTASDLHWSEITVLPDPPSEGFYNRLGFVDTGVRVPSRVSGGPVFSKFSLSLIRP
jgi:N-acetylglutamate synthase-like GNAT family acetyltransferase